MNEQTEKKEQKHYKNAKKLFFVKRLKKIKFILVWDKLSRHNVSIVSCTEGFDTSIPTGRAMMGVLGVFAQMERELTAEIVSFALAERAS